MFPMLILLINKEHVFDTRCFEYFQFISQLFIRIHINVLVSNSYTLCFHGHIISFCRVLAAKQ